MADLTTKRIRLRRLFFCLILCIGIIISCRNLIADLADTITVGDSPVGICVNPETNIVYVTNFNSNGVSVIDGSSHKIIKTIDVGENPDGIGINSETNRVYVANRISGTVSVISGSKNRVINTIETGNSPRGIGVNKRTNRIYVANHFSDNVSVIDGKHSRVIETIAVDRNPAYIGVNPKTNRIYVTNSGSNSVSVIDGSENKLIEVVAVGNSPSGVGIDTELNRIYVANNFSGNVSVIDGSTNKVTDTIVVGKGPMGVSVNSSINFACVTCIDNKGIYIIDSVYNMSIGSLSGNYAYVGVVCNENTDEVYVLIYEDRSVAVFKGLAGKVEVVRPFLKDGDIQLSLKIDSRPVGGEITLDGKYVGKAPYSVSVIDIGLGVHDIEVKREGCKAWRKSVDIKLGDDLTFVARMVLGTLSLNEIRINSEVYSMSNVSIREKKDWGFRGHSTINHNYNLKTIRGDKVVVDNATGLMWHQSGSDDYMEWDEAKEWVEDLNSEEGYAGYNDWRLPTVDEAVSLLEPSRTNGDLYIDPVFSKNQRWIWTGDMFEDEDEDGSEAAWCVYIYIGLVGWIDFDFSHYVRPVRSVE